MIQIERLRFRHIWSMMTRSRHDCWHVRTNKCVQTNICKTSVFVVSVRNINIFGRILTQFTGLLRANTVAAERNLLMERTGLGKSESVALRKKGPDYWLMLLLLPPKKLFSSFAWSSICSNLFGFEISVCWKYIFFFARPVSYKNPVLRFSRPGSCAWLSPYLLCADYTRVLVCACLYMCMWKCVGKVINI